MAEMHKEALVRFGLKHNAVLAGYMYKNLWWFLNEAEVAFGFGDLSEDDLFRIQGLLEEGEVFIGWHEHHGSRFQTTNVPIVKITKHEITFPTRDSHLRKEQ